MQTITAYEKDNSAMGRIFGFQKGMGMMKDHLFLGVGQNHFEVNYFKYPPFIEDTREGVAMVAHNSYAQIGAENGVIVLCLYLLMIFSTLINLERLQHKMIPSTNFSEINLARALQTSLVAYLVGSAALSLSHFELLYLLIGVSYLLTKEWTPANSEYNGLGNSNRKK